ncbi:MAG: HlyC/CorC family transporter [Flavobacteriales bacterium]|nr:HlyC/CorC family transporter [Flavobacteriales bacterium]
MTELIIWAVLSIAFSFLCSILEAVLLSVTPSYVRGQVSSGTATGQLLEEYKQDIDRPLSAILTLNTLAHTVGAIMVGATAGEIYGENYLTIGGKDIVSYEGAIAGAMTLLILVVSEIIPKTIGANNWKALVPFSVRAIRVILTILLPFVWMSQLITRSLKKEKEKAVLSRADFVAMAELGSSEGILRDTESAIINNVLAFEKQTVRDIMTPRSVTFMLSEETTVAEYMAFPESKTFSRVPIFLGEKDNVTGLILKDDALDVMARENGDIPLSDLRRDIPVVSDDLKLPELLKRISKSRQHMHLVTDDFGHVVGVVTMEDLFENLLGAEIVDESDVVVDLQAHAKEKWEKKIKDQE